MNEKRQQAYINLIQDLLNCPIGKEPEILAANRDLLDVGFLQTVEAQAEIALQQGDENTANWLRYLAIQMPDSQKNLQTYIQLLGAVLGAIQDSEGDAQVVYPILTANLDKLNDNFVQILQSWAKSRLYKVMRKEETQAIAKFIADLSHLIEEFPLGSKSNTIEIAIAGYDIASTIFKDHKTIKAWAFIQKFLANVYRERILGNRADNLEKAIAFLEAALEVFTRETDPEEWANTQHVLGATYYDRTVYPSEVASQLEKLQDEINAEQYHLHNGKEENPTFLVQHLQKLRQQHKELQDGYLPVGSGFKFDQFLSTLDERTAVIEWYITHNKILAFIIKPNSLTPFPSSERGEVIVWQSQSEDLKALIDWANEYLQDYYQQKDQWQNQLESRLKKLAQILHIEDLLTQIPKHCDKLILIPHRYLHLFPLHALPIQESCLLELFAQGVGYAPSCQLLQLSQQRQRPDFESVFAIQNPTEDLLFTDLEVNSILPLFSSHQVLPKTQATKTALSQAAPQLQQANYLHFSCHGLFNPDSPLDSCLVLAGANEEEAVDLSQCLTLGNLFDRDFDLNQCRLVTLSACETGLIDFKNTSDEYIGLPSGFLYAGSKCVVSSLWTVDDVSTALLMIRFYQNLKAGLTVAVALNQAQIWLQDVTTAELQTWASKLKLSPQVNKKLKQFLYYCEHYCEPEEKQFQNPYHWAAFCAIGL